jgi:hypothetical protein
MRVVILAVLGLLAFGACNRAEDRETGRTTADTMLTSEQTVDTTVVTHDTNVDVDVDVDTTHKEGDEPVRRDTVQR